MVGEHRKFLIFSDSLPEPCRKAPTVASAYNFGPKSEKSYVAGLSSAARCEEDLAGIVNERQELLCGMPIAFP
jgi:hypothetical protein